MPIHYTTHRYYSGSIQKITYVVEFVRKKITESESLHCPELKVGLYSTVMIRKITESLKSYSQSTRRNKEHNTTYVGGTYLYLTDTQFDS